MSWVSVFSVEIHGVWNLNEAASNLFKMLRFLDKTETNEIVVAPIPNKDVGLAINDKLKRASS